MDFEFMAFRDPLTGLYNRRFFYQHIEVELNRVMRYPSPISLALIDIDKFKEVNDTYGHHVGDLVLQGIGVFLQERLRKTDMVARLGGEEFVLLMPNTTEAEATHLLTSLLSGIRQKPIARYEGQEHFITFSAGITEWYPGLSVLDWTRHADYAMYKAKRNGRNRVAKSTANKGDYGQRASLSSSHHHEYKRVLIADDSKAIRVILMDKFKHWPLRFIEAEDGEEAYRILAGEPVDLCILDSIMPRLDGIGVLQRLQQEGTRSPNTRIIMLSGQEREEESRKGLELEADVYMVKPFSMLEMEMKVSELLGLA
ncbi:diguanylate cyclase [Paenibacillus cremeus]|nr:diguanylate cyclase [Paenibacillus cremeus]